MIQILRSLRGMWRTERLLLFIMVLCMFSSALLMQFSYGLYQNYHVVVQESTDDLKELNVKIVKEQNLPVGTFRDYIRALPSEISADAENIYCMALFGCFADHIDRTDAEWEAIRQEYAEYEDIPEDVDARMWEELEGLDDEERLKKRKEMMEPYKEKDIQHTIKDTIVDNENESYSQGAFVFRFTFQNGDFAPSAMYEANLEKNVRHGRKREASDRFFTKEEYASGAHVLYCSKTNEMEWESLKVDDTHISLFGVPYERIGNGSYNWEPPITAIPAETPMPANSSIDFLFEHSITKQRYDAMKSLAEEMMPGMLIFPDLPFPDNDTVYVSRNIMLIAALIAVLSVLNFVLLYQFLLQKRARTLAIFRINGCTAFRAVRMYLSECLMLGIPFYFAGLGVFILLMKCAFADIFPYMEGAFSFEVYAEIFAVWLISMLVLLIITVTLHVRKSILNTFYGREDA